MDRIKKMANRAKEHVKRNKFAYAAGGLALAAITLQQKNLKDFMDFLVEKDIDPMEFFNPEAYEELNN